MKKHILFVEDNPVLLSAYPMMLGSEAQRWEISLAPDGEAALEMMAQAPFDVLVSDLGLPGIGGIELIRLARERYPGCCRIVVSGLTDQEEVSRALNATHQFLAKPVEVKTLKGTLARVGALDAFLSHSALKSLVGRLGTLPSFPSLYVEIMKELGAEEPSVERIGEIISQDASMTAKLLQIANSAVMGLGRELTNPAEAVQHLGLSTVRSLALAVQIFSPLAQLRLKGFSLETLWAHNVRTAAIARRLMGLEGAEVGETDDAYTAGMLHDAGKLMLAHSLPRQFQEALDLAASQPCPLHEAEFQVFGATHAAVAAFLLGLWGLPATIVEAVAFHHSPAQGRAGGFGALTMVHAANVLEHEFFDDTPAALKPEMDATYLSALGLTDRVDIWRAAAVVA